LGLFFGLCFTSGLLLLRFRRLCPLFGHRLFLGISFLLRLSIGLRDRCLFCSIELTGLCGVIMKAFLNVFRQFSEIDL
jgi:hypothetical protein